MFEKLFVQSGLSLDRLKAFADIVAAKGIKKGDVFNEDNVAMKRPGTGLSPMFWDDVLGRRSPKDFAEDELITLE